MDSGLFPISCLFFLICSGPEDPFPSQFDQRVTLSGHNFSCHYTALGDHCLPPLPSNRTAPHCLLYIYSDQRLRFPGQFLLKHWKINAFTYFLLFTVLPATLSLHFHNSWSLAKLSSLRYGVWILSASLKSYLMYDTSKASVLMMFAGRSMIRRSKIPTQCW